MDWNKWRFLKNNLNIQIYLIVEIITITSTNKKNYAY